MNNRFVYFSINLALIVTFSSVGATGWTLVARQLLNGGTLSVSLAMLIEGFVIGTKLRCKNPLDPRLHGDDGEDDHDIGG